MSKVQDLLIEIGTEELPPKALLKLSNAFAENMAEELKQAELQYRHIHEYATPRRLALLITDLQEQQEDKRLDRRGPPLQAAFDENGDPTKAALGFAESCGININDVERIETDKGAWLFYQQTQAGQLTSALLPDMVNRALNKLPVPKRMRWADLDAQFVRPVHWLVLLFGKQIIDAEILSVRSDAVTYGHRFHHPAAIKLKTAADYKSKLLDKGRVIVDFNERRQQIVNQVTDIARQQNARAIIDDDLLDEVTSMVEWPVAILGHFEARFLEVPQEALISTMADNQKYFHLLDAQDRLLPHFITVTNIKSRDMAQVIEGNERVIRPRFSDAEFFWKQDRKHKLDSHIQALKGVVFHKKLGSLFDKTRRVASLATYIAGQIGADEQKVERTCELAKCDLMTSMVFEFTELQGVMGRYYALHDGEDPEVAQAIDEHYMPRFAGDVLPQTPSGQAVAIADRLDTILGIVAAGQLPGGDKDPYALRRAALGVLRIMIECNLSLDVQELLQKHVISLPENLHADNAVSDSFAFIMDRLRTYYLNQDIRADVYEAVQSQHPTRPNDFDARIKAVTAFLTEEAATSLAAANKRISNILKKSSEDIPEKIDHAILNEEAEGKLAKQVEALHETVQPLIAARDYTAILRQLAALRDNVDAFFDNVMVNVDEAALRKNRLAILNNLRNLFLDVADISKLQGAGA